VGLDKFINLWYNSTMTHGGQRAGAGRPKGSRNKVEVEVEDRLDIQPTIHVFPVLEITKTLPWACPRRGVKRDPTQPTVREKRARVDNFKHEPCADCAIVYPSYIMEFDHVTSDKIDSISSLIGWGTWEQIEQELGKCELVCANCHRTRTHKRHVENGRK